MCLAVPGCVLSVDDEEPTTRSGRVAFGGIERRVSLAFVPDRSALAVGWGTGSVELLDPEAERTLAELPHSSGVAAED